MSAIAVIAASSLIMALPGAAAERTWGSPEPAGATEQGAASAAEPWHTVTLVTGDRLSFRGGDDPAVVRLASPGRAHVPLRTAYAGDRLYAVPLDVEPLLADGRVDQRLFDLTGLVEAGYADADRDSVPIMVTTEPGVAAATAAAAAPGGRALTAGVAAADVAKRDAAATWAALRDATGSAQLWLDGMRTTTLDHSVPQIGAPAAYAAGLTGAGTSVAVLDTGIDQSHPDLAGRVAAARNFTEEPDGDQVGHGTHVASTVGGTGAASDGRYRGVAYEAALLDGKVCESFGCQESAILAGMEWAAAEMGADVVNMSLGGYDSPGDDPLEAAINRLTAEHGTLFVVAAGNDGMPGSVGSPSTADAALSVGAVDRDDVLAPFSSRGPRHDGAVKPEVTAPGVQIVAAAATGVFEDPYFAASGTSMAAPHVAGAAALLAQQHPDWTAAQLKALLVGSARPNGSATVYDEGAGRVDIAAAIGHTVLAEPPTVSFGRTEWPHDDDEAVTRTTRLANTGATAVTLALALDVTGPDGVEPPAGMFTLAATEVTIPAGGSADVTMTADTSAGGPDGPYSGLLTATGDGADVAVPFGVDQEVESHGLTLRSIGADGAPGFVSAVLIDLQRGSLRFVAVDGETTLRVPVGRYFVEALDGDADDITDMVAPGVTVAGPTTVTLDVREARPVDVTVPATGLERAALMTALEVRLPDGFAGTIISLAAEQRLRTDHIGDANDAFSANVSTFWAVPDGAGWYDGSPRLDATLDVSPAGRYFDGLRKRYRARDFAEVDARHHGTPDRTATVVTFGNGPDGGVGVGVGARYSLPSSRVERLAGEDALWSAMFRHERPDTSVDHVLFGELRAYRPGQRVVEHWNQPVFGPALPAEPGLSLARLGDQIAVGPPLYSDAAGHVGDLLSGSTTIRLLRDGVEIGRSASTFAVFDVPPEPGNYRVEIESATDHRLTTDIALAWEFYSEHVAGDDPALVPATVARHTPWLDDAGAAPGGVPYLVPVRLERQGLPVSDVRRVHVDVSYDDGVTWRRAPLLGLGSHQVRAAELDAEQLRGAHSVALLWHPRGPGFVSLRTTTTDRDGNTSAQTLIRAYALR